MGWFCVTTALFRWRNVWAFFILFRNLIWSFRFHIEATEKKKIITLLSRKLWNIDFFHDFIEFVQQQDGRDFFCNGIHFYIVTVKLILNKKPLHTSFKLFHVENRVEAIAPTGQNFFFLIQWN